MKTEELMTVRNANREIWVLATKLDKRQEIEGTEIDKVIANLLKDVTFLLDEIENLENCKPF